MILEYIHLYSPYSPLYSSLFFILYSYFLVMAEVVNVRTELYTVMLPLVVLNF